MATRLTAFSKFVITLLILGVIFGGGYLLLNKTSFGSNLKKKADETKQEDASKTEPQKTNFNDDENTLVVQLVTWGGYGPGLYFNEGATPNENSRFFKEYGFKVRFV
ncbi:MAG TPA: hypothetical protein VFF90_14240, partial [Saprospiraceae bacterium]|nr:hypothetical protein [Saprospiraceae bacterium]